MIEGASISQPQDERQKGVGEQHMDDGGSLVGLQSLVFTHRRRSRRRRDQRNPNQISANYSGASRYRFTVGRSGSHVQLFIVAPFFLVQRNGVLLVGDAEVAGETTRKMGFVTIKKN